MEVLTWDRISMISFSAAARPRRATGKEIKTKKPFRGRGRAYLERVTVNNVKNVKNAKKAIEKAFRYQVEGKGFSLIEVLSACPTNWGLTPQKALEWIDEKMIPYYPLGVYRDKEG